MIRYDSLVHPSGGGSGEEPLADVGFMLARQVGSETGLGTGLGIFTVALYG
jgi:hypothetical protein